jgi:PAS domain S-box-containing protein
MLTTVDRRYGPAMASDSVHVLDRVLLAMPDQAVAVCDTAGVITSWNIGAADLTGVPAGDAVGRDLQWLEGPGGSSTTAKLLARARRGTVRREAWRNHADGSAYWCVSTLFAVAGVDGETVAYAEGFHDGTAGHRALLEQAQRPATAVAARSAEAKLRESEARLARAEAIARIGSWEWDLGSAQGTWSDGLYALYDMAPEDQRSRKHPFYDRVHPHDLARVKAIVERASETGGAFACDHRVLLPGGRVRFVRSRGEVTTDEAGNPVHMAGTAMDITEAQETDDALERAARALSGSAADLERARRTVKQPGEDLARVLTHRQLEVLTLVAEGLRNDQIATRLVISEATVKWHVRHVLRALGVTTRAQAAIRYLNDAE